MSDLRTLELGAVSVREDADGNGSTIDGYAYRWGDRAAGPRSIRDCARASIRRVHWTLSPRAVIDRSRS